jgi:tetratricopeptide (TPR) repeat protein
MPRAIAIGAWAAIALLGCQKQSSEPAVTDRVPPPPVEAANAEPTAAPDPIAEGHILVKTGDNTGAIAAFTRALEAAPGDAKTYVFRAAVYIKVGQYERAMMDLNRSIKLDPKDPDAYEQRAITLGAGGATSLAIEDFTRAIQLKPPTMTMMLHINRGYAFQQLGAFAKAAADYDEARRLVPTNALPYEYRGGLYYDQGKLSAALAEFNEAIHVSPDAGEVFLNRGLVYEKLHKPDMALADYSEAIRLDPRLVDAYRHRAVLNIAAGRIVEGRRDAAKAHELENRDGPKRSAQLPGAR